MTTMPMFPLGSVLFPHMPLSLRIFEERYIVMLSRLVQTESYEFGVVLIERGQEVGGGEKRFSIGTVAMITQLEAAEGFVAVVAVGNGRIAITEWLDEDPHPQATVSELPDLTWDDALLPLQERAEKLVRRTLARASEFVELTWSPDVELSEEPVVRAWQLAAIAPLGPLDQMSLLRSATMSELLGGVIEHTLDVELSLTSSWKGGGLDDTFDEPDVP